ncbi:hypothetical protein BpHYR1_019469 [Brachionus plicatilis]|uniref:Uncharacterized protein n=1 Tax=Brachionus plicatilis TaxID=10195 RepID=A0A3M7RBX5_BRAPC|nr:hypothetical protein BpHYR1_019469 [Brachionus plicatilis]
MQNYLTFSLEISDKRKEDLEKKFHPGFEILTLDKKYRLKIFIIAILLFITFLKYKLKEKKKRLKKKMCCMMACFHVLTCLQTTTKIGLNRQINKLDDIVFIILNRTHKPLFNFPKICLKLNYTSSLSPLKLATVELAAARAAATNKDGFVSNSVDKLELTALDEPFCPEANAAVANAANAGLIKLGFKFCMNCWLSVWFKASAFSLEISDFGETKLDFLPFDL